MDARQIGEIVAPIFAEAISKAAELHGAQVLLSVCDSDAARKRCIMGWLAAGFIDDEQARLLIESALLEAA